MKKKGFTLIELLIVVVIVGILALAAIPLIASNTEEARSSEARAALGAMKDRARVVHQRTGAAVAKTDLGLGATELNGSYFADADYTVSNTAAATWRAECANVYSQAAGSPSSVNLICDCNLVSGGASFNR